MPDSFPGKTRYQAEALPIEDLTLTASAGYLYSIYEGGSIANPVAGVNGRLFEGAAFITLT